MTDQTPPCEQSSLRCCCICMQDKNNLQKYCCFAKLTSSFELCTECVKRLVDAHNPGDHLDSTDPSDLLNPNSPMHKGLFRCPLCCNPSSFKDTFSIKLPKIFFGQLTQAFTPVSRNSGNCKITTLYDLSPSELVVSGNDQAMFISEKKRSIYTGRIVIFCGIYVSLGAQIFDQNDRQWKPIETMPGAQIVEITDFEVVSLKLSNASPPTITLGQGKNIFALSDNPPH